MPQKPSPCQLGYPCIYCRQVDSNHAVCMLPRCPLVWDGEDVLDTFTDRHYKFVTRPEPKPEKEDDRRYDIIPTFTSHAGGRKVQTGLYRS